MKFNLTWRYKHKIGEIDIQSDKIVEWIKKTLEAGKFPRIGMSYTVRKDPFTGEEIDYKIHNLALLTDIDNNETWRVYPYSGVIVKPCDDCEHDNAGHIATSMCGKCEYNPNLRSHWKLKRGYMRKKNE